MQDQNVYARRVLNNVPGTKVLSISVNPATIQVLLQFKGRGVPSRLMNQRLLRVDRTDDFKKDVKSLQDVMNQARDSYVKTMRKLDVDDYN